MTNTEKDYIWVCCFDDVYSGYHEIRAFKQKQDADQFYKTRLKEQEEWFVKKIQVDSTEPTDWW